MCICESVPFSWCHIVCFAFFQRTGLQIRKDTTSAQNTIYGSFEAQQEYSTKMQAYNIKKTHGYIQGISELNQNWNV